MARVGIQRMKFAKIWLCITITFSLVLLSDFASSFADGGLELPKLDLHDTRLENGLRVILVPDHSAPVYAINVSYNVGSRNELARPYRLRSSVRTHDVPGLRQCRQRRAFHPRPE